MIFGFQGKGGGGINVVSKKKLSQTPENYAKLRYNFFHSIRFLQTSLSHVFLTF